MMGVEQKIITVIIGIVIALIAMLMFGGCANLGIEFQSEYGSVRYDGDTLSLRLPEDRALRK